MILLILWTMKTPENIEERHISIYRPCNGSECATQRSFKEMNSSVGEVFMS